MHKAPGILLETSRLRVPGFEHRPGTFNGAFYLHSHKLRIIASDSSYEGFRDWEHVSVSTSTRCPTWEEMCLVKSLFWDDEETVYQLHPPKSQWISNHPFVLHLWRNVRQDPPMPPGILVGIQQDGEYKNKAEAEAGYRRAIKRGDVK
jgi:hypothetical protein